MTPLGNKTLGVLTANLKARAALYTEQKITSKLIKDLFNEVIDEMNGIAGPKDKSFYKESYTIPQLTSVNVTVSDSAVSFTLSTRRLIIPGTQTDGTVVWTNDTAFSSNWIGAPVVWLSNKKGVLYTSEIESIVNGTTVVLKNAAGLSSAILPAADMPGTEIVDLLITLNVSTSDSIKIGTMSAFKYIDYITGIEDSLTAEVIEIEDSREFNAIAKEGSSSAYSNSIIWNQEGDVIRFKRGSSVSSYGVRTMRIVRTPVPMSLASDYIDVRPANIGQVNDIVLYRVLRAKKVQAIPQEVQQAEINLQKQKAAFMEERKLEDKEK